MGFLSGEWLGGFFLPSSPVADIIHNSQVKCFEVVSYTYYGLHTADFAATSILLQQNYSHPGLRLATACLASRTGTAATTHGCRDCLGCNRDDDRRNSPRLRLSHLL